MHPPPPERMMIKVRHTDHQPFACVKIAHSDFMKEFNARNINGVLKSEIKFLYTRLPLSASVIAGYSSCSATLDPTDVD